MYHHVQRYIIPKMCQKHVQSKVSVPLFLYHNAKMYQILYHPVQRFLYHYVSTIYYTKDVPKTLYIQRFLYQKRTILSKGFCTTMCQTLPALLTLASQLLRQVSAATTTSRYILSMKKIQIKNTNTSYQLKRYK